MSIAKIKPITFLFLLTIFVTDLEQGIHAANRATAAFEKLQSLAGDWEGKDEEGNTVKSNFKAIASKTTLLETLSVSGMEEMVTLYNVDGDGIALMHYCPTNNQPRMRAIPQSGDVKELVFSFQGAGNLPSLDIGHEHKLVIEFLDKDHLVERWTWRKKAKDMEMIYHLARKNGN